MIIKSIEFENFRNLSKGIYKPCEGINVISGKNAQGKTNLLELIWLFTGQKSFRGAKDSEMIKFGEDFSRNSLDFISHEREQKANLVIEKKRIASLNGVQLAMPRELGEQFSAVVFSPDHLNMVKDGPSARREFIDTAISSLRPNYRKSLSLYIRALMQRNKALKTRDKNYDAVLDVFEYHLSVLGAYILKQRQKYLFALSPYVAEIYSGLCNKKEKIELLYKSTSEESEAEYIAKKLRESRTEDYITGSTGVGIHRDDIEFLLDENPLRLYGSQGQQRSSVLAVKLAEAQLLKKHFEEQPIAILDDVMSELDEERQDYILNHIKNWQVFISCCDMNGIKKLKEGHVVKVKSGVLS